MARIYDPPKSFFEHAREIAQDASAQGGMEFIVRLKEEASQALMQVFDGVDEWKREKKRLGFLPVDGPETREALIEKRQEAGFEFAVLNWLECYAVFLFTGKDGRPLQYESDKVFKMIKAIQGMLLQSYRDEGRRIRCRFRTDDDCDTVYSILEHLINGYYPHTTDAESMMRISDNSPSLILSKSKMGPILEREFGLTLHRESGEWLEH